MYSTLNARSRSVPPISRQKKATRSLHAFFLHRLRKKEGQGQRNIKGVTDTQRSIHSYSIHPTLHIHPLSRLHYHHQPIRPFPFFRFAAGSAIPAVNLATLYKEHHRKGAHKQQWRHFIKQLYTWRILLCLRQEDAGRQLEGWHPRSD